MADHPLYRLLRIFAPLAEAMEKLAPGQAIRAAYDRDYDRAVCRAADALADDEAEYEVLEPTSTLASYLKRSASSYCKAERPHRNPAQRWCCMREVGHSGKHAYGGILWDNEIEMDWLGWAVPAILTELDLHRYRRDRYCRCRLYCETYPEWADHIAPLIAERIGCDPTRAAEVLLRYKPDKVDL